VAVQWLNQVLCIDQSFYLVDRLVLQNRHLWVAAKRFLPSVVSLFVSLLKSPSSFKEPFSIFLNFYNSFLRLPFRQSYSYEPEIQFALQKFFSKITLPASSIQHPASSIQHPASSIHHPASSIQHPASSIYN